MTSIECTSELYTTMKGGLQTLMKEATHEELTQCYDDNARIYHELCQFSQFNTTGCRALAEVVAELQPNKEARILDCAAGSGLAGQQLHELGFKNIDALDPSEGLLDIARSLNVYTNLIVDSVSPDKRNSVADATYDAILISGAVLQGHISLDCIPEITRMLKKGGTLSFNIADNYLNTDPNFQEEAVNKRFQEYVDNGKWLKWDVRRAPYSINPVEGGEETKWCKIFSIFI